MWFDLQTFANIATVAGAAAAQAEAVHQANGRGLRTMSQAEFDKLQRASAGEAGDKHLPDVVQPLALPPSMRAAGAY